MNLKDILMYADPNSIKISEVITDHQKAFSTNIGDKSIDHYDLIRETEWEMYPSLTPTEIIERREENAHIFLVGVGAYIMKKLVLHKYQ